MLWFKSGDVRGVRTLVDLSSDVDPSVHREEEGANSIDFCSQAWYLELIQ